MLFGLILVTLAVAALVIVLIPVIINSCKKSEPAENDAAFKKLQRIYLVVYAFAVAGDWFQGAHLYELYHDKGVPKNQIELLFLVGFLSSLAVGTVIGSLADKLGRKKIAALYGILYIITCITANFSHFWIFAIGRLAGGIATSILFSAFESWVVHEHQEKNFSAIQLGALFSNQALINSIVAVVCGVSAQWAVNHFGNSSPFNIAILDLLIMIVLLCLLWKENFGDEAASVSSHFGTAFKSIFTDLNVLCLGLVQSLFEGVMYTFIVQWTPAMREAFEPRELDHGYIFATFMVAVAIGSAVFKVATGFIKPAKFMIGVLLLSAACMTPPFLFPRQPALIYAGFIIFEGCVGIFWPSMGYLRGVYLPEEGRATIMNLFRVPLNCIVIFMMLMNFNIHTTFMICSFLLLLACICQLVLSMRAGSSPKKMADNLGEVPEDPAAVKLPLTSVKAEERNGNLEKVENGADALPLIDEDVDVENGGAEEKRNGSVPKVKTVEVWGFNP